MSKIRLAVLMGGPSREHEVSLKSGEAVCGALDHTKYEITEVLIDLSGVWHLDKQGKGLPGAAAVQAIVDKKIEVAFLALHGSYGEDGTVQALLEQYHIPYTGSDVRASLLAMNKVITGELFAQHGLRMPRSLILSRYDLVNRSDLLEGLDYPVIVKPANQGSSVGVSLVDAESDVIPAIEFALEHDNQIIVQQYIKGREVSCGVLEQSDGEIKSLPPTELIPANADFFDYYAKYTAGATNEITPPDMDSKTIQAIQDIAIQTHNIIGCRAYSRTDMIVTDKDIYVIEINTLPGLTETSILPQQAAAADIGFAEMLDGIIESAIKRKGN